VAQSAPGWELRTEQKKYANAIFEF